MKGSVLPMIVFLTLPVLVHMACVDTAPDAQSTCAQQKAWNKCPETWMKNFCQVSCGTCPQECEDVAPDNQFTCAEQKAWGKCGESFMNGKCLRTCGTCPAAGGCTDLVPSGEYSCAQQAAWGKCGETWMAGKCDKTCGRCGGTSAPPAPPPPPPPPTVPTTPTCADTPPAGAYTCRQQKEWGKCFGFDFMVGKCDITCGRCTPSGPSPSPAPAPAPAPPSPAPVSFTVKGGLIYDLAGKQFVMRGVNMPLQWYFDKVSDPAVMKAVATLGFNTVRLVWDPIRSQDLGLAKLKQVLDVIIANKLVPMLEIHSITGVPGVDALRSVAKYLKASKDFLAQYSEFLHVNIANEWPPGWDTQSNNDWFNGYMEVVPDLRKAGLNHLLVIDAGGYGQNPEGTILNGDWASQIVKADPLHNVVFSAHLYDVFGTDDHVKNVIKAAKDKGIAFIVGEFGQQHLRSPECKPVAYQAILKYCDDSDGSIGRKTGWLAWSWKGNNDETSYLDLVSCAPNSNCNQAAHVTCPGGNWAVTARSDFGSDWGQKVLDALSGSQTSVARKAFSFYAPDDQEYKAALEAANADPANAAPVVSPASSVFSFASSLYCVGSLLFASLLLAVYN